MESARLIAGLARMVRDVGLAEELAQDALVVALEQWPESGVPDNPGAWLMATAKHRAIDLLAPRRTCSSASTRSSGRELEVEQEIGRAGSRCGARRRHRRRPAAAHLHRLPLRCSRPRRAWRSPCGCSAGLTTEEIARAFLVPEPTIAQRIVRAKRTLAEAHVPFEVPRGAERAARLSSVLEVIYLVFNEGYSATAGDDWMRPALCEDALRLGRILAELAPKEPEVHGLVALMEIQASRLRARVGPSGEPILLLDQDRARWDQLLIRRGLAALERAEALGGALGPYVLQAAIAACHARARTRRGDRLGAHRGAVRRACPARAVTGRGAEPGGRGRHGVRAGGGARAGGRAGRRSRRCRHYHLLPSVRGDLLAKLGRTRRGAGGVRARRLAHAATHGSASCSSRAPPRARRLVTTSPDRPARQSQVWVQLGSVMRSWCRCWHEDHRGGWCG